ncbi:calcium-binding protein [Nocardioides sp. T5]|uniref:calcium-binding protein n=1 Tax=Nocardioides sp. T5 TaxID=3400182 RepID=UPI003A839DB8
MAPRLALAGLALVAPLLPAVPAGAVAGTCEGRPATHLGTPGDDVLTGTDGDDVMVGLGGDDTIWGLLGNDVICGDEGSDTLIGRAGDDRLLGGLDSDAGGDIIWPGVGNDFVDGGLDPLTRDDYSVPADTVLYSDLLAAGFPGGIRADLTPVGGLGFVAEPSGTDQIVVTEAQSIAGTRTADVLIGSPYLDVLVGRGGADQIDGAGGNDTLLSDFTDAVVDPATDGPDDIDGGPGTDWIALGQAGGTARGGEDMDHLEAHPATGPAVLRGQDGDDQLWAQSVEDVDVDGGRGHDDIDVRLTPASRGVSVDGGSARDLVTFDVRKAGFGKGSTITVDLGRGVLRAKARAGRLRGLEVLWIKGEDARWRIRGTHRNEDVIMQGGRSLEASMRGGRDSVVATRGRDVLDLGQGRGDFANGRMGRDTCLGAERVRSCEVLRSGRSDRAARQAGTTERDAVERLERGLHVVARMPIEVSALRR